MQLVDIFIFQSETKRTNPQIFQILQVFSRTLNSVKSQLYSKTKPGQAFQNFFNFCWIYYNYYNT